MALATLVLTVLLYMLIPKGLFPTQDTGQLQARVETAQSVSYARMAELQQAAARAILQDPDVDALSSFIGVDAANNTMLHTGRMLINLKHERTGSQQADHGPAARARQPGRRRDAVPAADAGPDDRRRNRPDAVPRVDGRRRATATVVEWANKLAERMALSASAAQRGVATPAPRARRPTSTSTATRRRAWASPPSAIDDALYSAFGQRIVSTIFTETNQYRVILEALPDALATPASLGNLHAAAPAPARPRRCRRSPRITEQPAPLQITHVAQYPATTLGFDTAPGVSLGKAVDDDPRRRPRTSPCRPA